MWAKIYYICNMATINFIICVLTCLQVYVMKWIVPVYKKINTTDISTNATLNSTNIAQGYWYLLILALAVGLIIVSLSINKKRS